MARQADIYREAFDAAVAAALSAAAERLPAAQVGERAQQLLMRDPAERRALLQSDLYFRRPEVFGRLAALSFAERHRDPARMLEIARVAFEVAEALPARAELPAGVVVADLKAEAHACLANALRIVGDIQQADLLWPPATELRYGGSGDPLLAARLAALEANLRADQRRLVEAEVLFNRAARLYEHVGDSHLAGRTLVDLARTFHEAGQPDRAIATLVAGAQKLDLSREPSLYLLVVHNLANYLDAAGYPAHALRLLQSVRDRRASRRSHLQLLRARWLEARISATLGLSDLAAQVLREVCTDLLDLKLPYDAALAALELAAVYSEAGRLDEVQRLAEEVYPVFIARAIPREASVALLLFYRSALARTASRELLAGLEARLREHRKT